MRVRSGLVFLLLLLLVTSCHGGRSRSKRAGTATSASATPALTAPADSKALASGGRWQLVRQGKQPGPQPPNRLRAQVSVWTPAGKKIFSSIPSQDGLSVDLDSLSPALREVVRLAGIGGAVRLWLPPDGMAGWEPKSFPPGDLIFEIEVLAEGPADVTNTVPLDAPATTASPTLAPPDLADAPKDSLTTRSGLKYVVQRDGTGPHPNGNATSRLSVNAWAKRGLTLEERERNFAVTVTTVSAPAGLGEVLAQLGTDGKARVWVPASRAKDLFPQHKDQALILDVTLTGFDKE